MLFQHNQLETLRFEGEWCKSSTFKDVKITCQYSFCKIKMVINSNKIVFLHTYHWVKFQITCFQVNLVMKCSIVV